jgi:hypothetical protein
MIEKLKVCLYLDDCRTPTETIRGYYPWHVVRSYEEFKDFIIMSAMPDLISFDHDLADEHSNDYFNQVAAQGYQQPNYESYKEKTGLDCAKFLVEYCQKMKISLKQCCVHSHNPVGAKNIQDFLNGFKKHMGEEQDCFLMKHPFEVTK